jgi:L-fuculose-phosphate aldolase
MISKNKNNLLAYNNMEISNPVKTLIKISKLMFDRNLTDTCGGNLSLRHNNKIYMTPRFSAEYFNWDLPEEKINIFGLDNKLISGKEDEISREGKLHLGIYNMFDEINAVIHGHPPNLITFSLLEDDVKKKLNKMSRTHMLKGRLNDDIIECDRRLPQVSEEQTNNIIGLISERLKIEKSKNTAIILRTHGLVVTSSNIFKAFSLFEAIEINTKIVIAKAQIEAIK